MLELLIPEATTNYVENPSLGTDTTGWTALLGTTISRSLVQARFGKASLYCNCPGAAPREGAFYAANIGQSLQPVTGSLYVRGFGKVRIYIRADDNSQEWLGKPIQLHPDFWIRLQVTGFIGAVAETDMRVGVLTDYNHKAQFYVDGAQLELKGHVTTYCDGDLELELPVHGGTPYFEWVGQRHATRSFRSASYRGGGRFKDISQGIHYDLFPSVAAGLGMPPLALGFQVFSGQERAVMQSVKAQPRELQIAMHARRMPWMDECDPQSLVALRTARKALLEVLKPDVVGGVQPAILRYTEGNVPMQLEVAYGAGMEFEGDLRSPALNSFGLRLFCQDPYWRTDSQDIKQLTPSASPDTLHAFLIARLTGEWDGFGSATFPIRVIKVHPNGDVYAGGDFTTIGGVAARRLARWDGTQWNILAGAGADIDNGSVYCIDFDNQGRVWFGGTFTTINGSTFNRCGYYDPATDSFGTCGAVGNEGLNSDVNAVVVNRLGYVYFGGAFTAQTGVGGTTCYRVAKYDPSGATFANMGDHDGLALDVECMAIDLDGETLFLGGQFRDEYSHAGGTALDHICKYNPTTDKFEAIAEDGLNGNCYGMALALDGKLYIGGAFTTAGFWTVAKCAYWNRDEFYPLGADGDGLTGGTQVNVVTIDAEGNVYFGGDFTAATNDALAAYVAVWNGTRFAHLDLSVGATVYAIAAKYSKLFLGYNGASVSSIADVQTVTNNGLAASYPILDIKGPVVARYLENQTTGKVLRMNLVVQDEERVLVDLRPGYLKAISEWRGNVMSGIYPDSDFGDWKLLPGDNTISFHGTGSDAGTEVVLRWQIADWSFDQAR